MPTYIPDAAATLVYGQGTPRHAAGAVLWHLARQAPLQVAEGLKAAGYAPAEVAWALVSSARPDLVVPVPAGPRSAAWWTPPSEATGTRGALAATLKGGAGSGNFGHAGRPGLVGGSGPGGGSQPAAREWPPEKGGRLDATNTVTGFYLKGNGYPPDFIMAGIEGELRDVIRTVTADVFSNFPPNTVEAMVALRVTPTKGEAFTAGGRQFVAGGDWHEATGTVSLYGLTDAEKAETNLRDILPHEVGHALHDLWVTGASVEAQLFKNDHMDSYGGANESFADPLQHASRFQYGDSGLVPPEIFAQSKLREEIRQEYPLLYTHQKFFEAWQNGGSGVTPYTAAWAKDGVWHEDAAEIIGRYIDMDKGHGAAARASLLRTSYPEKHLGCAEAVAAVMPHLQRRIGREKAKYQNRQG